MGRGRQWLPVPVLRPEPLTTKSVEELYLLLSNKRDVTTILGERVLGVESEDPILVAALTRGESRAHFPDGNNNSGSSLYLGTLAGLEIMKAVSTSEERCLETQGDVMVPAAWVGGVEPMRGYVSMYD